MDLTHIHLLLNHVPTVGTIIGIGLLLLGWAAKRDHVKEVSLVVLLGVALVTIPTYITGNAAAEKICKRTGPNTPCAGPHSIASIDRSARGRGLPAPCS